MELEALAKSAADFNAAGASLVLISPQLEEHNQAIAQDKKLVVPILSDPGNQVAQAYGLRYEYPEDLKQLYQQFGIHLNQYNGDDSWSLPMPARLIIDTQGIIRYAEINPDYTQRPEPEGTLAVLNSLV
jgi:peroxiredoxin